MSDEKIVGEGLELCSETVYEIYDPWTAQLRGLFYNEDDARLFFDALIELKGRLGNYA